MPLMHRAVLVQSALALQGTLGAESGTLDASDASDASAPSIALDPSRARDVSGASNGAATSAGASELWYARPSGVAESNAAASLAIAASRDGDGTHWDCPPESLHVYPGWHPPLQSLPLPPLLLELPPLVETGMQLSPLLGEEAPHV